MEPLSSDYLDALCEIDNMCMSAAAVRLEKKAGCQVKLIKPQAKQGVFGEFLNHLPEGDKSFLIMSFSSIYKGDFMFVFLTSDISVLFSKLKASGSARSDKECAELIASDFHEGIAETMSMLIGKNDVVSEFKSFDSNIGDDWHKKDIVFVDMQFKVADEVSSHFWHIVPSGLGIAMAKDMLGEIDSKLEQFSKTVSDEAGQKCPSAEGDTPADIEIDVPVELCVEICRKEVLLKDLWNLSIGSIIEFKKGIKEPLDIQIKGKPYGRAQVVTVGERFGVRITEVVDYAKSISRR